MTPKENLHMAATRQPLTVDSPWTDKQRGSQAAWCMSINSYARADFYSRDWRRQEGKPRMHLYVLIMWNVFFLFQYFIIACYRASGQVISMQNYWYIGRIYKTKQERTDLSIGVPVTHERVSFGCISTCPHNFVFLVMDLYFTAGKQRG